MDSNAGLLKAPQEALAFLKSKRLTYNRQAQEQAQKLEQAIEDVKQEQNSEHAKRRGEWYD